MANKVFNMAGGRHSAAAYSAFEDALYGSCVATDSDFVATAGTGMTVQLTSGNGLISTGSGYARRIQADSTNTITITAASATLSRTDSIVAYIDNAVTPTTSVTDNTNNILRFVAVAGTPASTPSAPSAVTIQSAVGAGNPYMVLWNVTIPAGATAMNTAVFTDQRKVAKFEITDGSITSSKLASNAVTTAKINANAVTAAKVDMSTFTSSAMPAITWDSGILPAKSAFNGRTYMNLVLIDNAYAARSQTAWNTSWQTLGTLPVGCRPVEETLFSAIFTNLDTGAPSGYGRVRIGTNGVVEGRAQATVSNAYCCFSGIFTTA